MTFQEYNMEAIKITDSFIKQYEGLIYSEIRAKGIHNQDMIEDIFGNTVIRIMETRDNYNEDKGSISTWLVFQTRSVISNYLKSRRLSEDALDYAVSSPEERELYESVQLHEEDDTDTRASTLAYDLIYESSLDEDDKRLLYDFFVAGFTQAELSKQHNVHYKTIKNRIDKLLEILKKEYEV